MNMDMSPEVVVAIVTAICTALPLVLAQIAQIIRASKQAERDKRDTFEKIEEVKKVAAYDKGEVDLMVTGAFRSGHQAGVKYERTGSTEPGPLHIR
jgi:NADH:ubiquinone oxidoreductase subunit 3 (subunit A)